MRHPATLITMPIPANYYNIFEKLIYKRLVCFLEQNNVLHEQQFGFRQNYSTSLAINELVNKCHESVECNNFMLGIFIDLSRAFDTLSHEKYFVIN